MYIYNYCYIIQFMYYIVSNAIVVFLSQVSHIIATMYLLLFVDVFKWGFFDTLMNPILSDSFGFTLTESSYFYLGFSVARIIAALSV